LQKPGASTSAKGVRKREAAWRARRGSLNLKNVTAGKRRGRRERNPPAQPIRNGNAGGGEWGKLQAYMGEGLRVKVSTEHIRSGG